MDLCQGGDCKRIYYGIVGGALVVVGVVVVYYLFIKPNQVQTRYGFMQQPQVPQLQQPQHPQQEMKTVHKMTIREMDNKEANKARQTMFGMN